MTAADVNVTEKVARAAWDHDNAEMSQTWRDVAWSDMGGSEPAVERAEYEIRAAAALAALRSPEVVAGIAGVLVHEQSSGLCDYGKVCDLCDCFADRDGGRQRDRYALDEARAVVEWITGRAG